MEPFIVIGPVLIGGGVMTVFFSVEVRKKGHWQIFRFPKNFLNISKVCCARFVIDSTWPTSECWTLTWTRLSILMRLRIFLVMMISFSFSSFLSKCGLLQKVKHWMDPQLIPYGWGLFKEEEEVRKDSNNVMKET